MNTIGFDIDGVLYPVHKIAYTELVANHNLKIPFTKFWEDYKKYYSKIFWDNFFKLPFLYERAVPTKEILDTVNYLSNKYNIVYITSRPKDVKFVTKWWLKNYKFPNYDNIFFSKDKTIEIRKNKCLYFIEDRGKQEEIDGMNKITNVILVNQVWNKHITGVPRIQELNELKELL